MTWIKEALSVVGQVLGIISKGSERKEDVKEVRNDRKEVAQIKKTVRAWYKMHYDKKWREKLNKDLTGTNYVDLYQEIKNEIDDK
jgi:hypothetical protein